MTIQRSPDNTPSPELTTKLLFGMLESLFPNGLFNKPEIASLVEKVFVSLPEKGAQPTSTPLQAKTREIRTLSQGLKSESGPPQGMPEKASSQRPGTSSATSKPARPDQKFGPIADNGVLTSTIRAALQHMMKGARSENLEEVVRELIQAVGKTEFASRFGHPPSYDFSAEKGGENEKKPIPFPKQRNGSVKEERLTEKHTVMSSEKQLLDKTESNRIPLGQAKPSLPLQQKQEAHTQKQTTVGGEKREESVRIEAKQQLSATPLREMKDEMSAQKPHEPLAVKNTPPTPTQAQAQTTSFFNPKNMGPLPSSTPNVQDNNPNPILTVGPFIVPHLTASNLLKKKKKETEEEAEDDESDPDQKSR